MCQCSSHPQKEDGSHYTTVAAILLIKWKTKTKHHTVRTITKYHTVRTITKYHTVRTITKYHTVKTITKYHTVRTITKYHTFRTITKYHTVRTITKSRIEIVETETKSIPLIHVSLSWLGTDTFI